MSPPRPPFVLGLGVTGHRKAALAGHEAELRRRVDDALRLIVEAAHAVHQRDADCFNGEPPLLHLVSPMADGADQIVAEAALAQGFELHAVLPFAREHYDATLEDEAARSRAERLLERAKCTIELPGTSSSELDAYVMTGRATIAHCDVLLAVWDGLLARGRGGTGEVVELAVAEGTPVVHIPLDGSPERLLWAAFDPAVRTRGVDSTVARPLESEHIEQMLAGLLLPPANAQEREFLKIFCTEHARSIRTRIEYPLLLAATGVARFDARSLRDSRSADAIEEEWRNFRETCVRAHGIEAPFELLEQSYSWTDRLATHFAQTYRSGHIFNFLLGGVAVCLGLSSFMAPDARLWLALVEFVITGAIIINTRIGIRREWHRKWLDYRQLAERLRPMRTLQLLGIAAPDPPGTITNPTPRRWIDWYATAVWRAMGCPSGRIDRERAKQLAQSIADCEIAPQVAYQEKSAVQIEAFDTRLERIATLLFWGTLVVSVITAAGLAFKPDWIARVDNWFTLISAGFPALGTAVFGIRFQGDFGGSAVRSQATADALRYIADELRKDVTLIRAADLSEQAARTMLADLDEWRLVNEQQDLDIA